MPYFVDPTTREVWEYSDPSDAERDGLAPASEQDIAQHNSALEERDQRQAEWEEDRRWDALSFGEKAGEVAQGIGLGALKGAHALAGATGNENVFGVGDAYREAQGLGADEFLARHPISGGIGQALPLAPLALATGGAAAAAAGGLAGAAGLGAGATAAAAIGAEELVGGAVAAAAQEYGDAWLQERPVELGNIAEGTLWNAGGGLALRGVGSVLKGSAGGLLGRARESLVSRAARKSAARRTAGAKFATADEAAKFDEIADQALREMSEDDLQSLMNHQDSILDAASYKAANSLNNLFRAGGDELGVGVKYENWQRFANDWTDDMVESQTRFAAEVRKRAELAQGALIVSRNKGYDLRGVGARLFDTLDQFNRRLAEAPNPVQRAEMLDHFKRQLDTFDATVANSKLDPGSKAVIQKDIVNRLANFVRTGLEDEASFGRAALEQQAENPIWVRLIQAQKRLEGKYVGKSPIEEYGEIGFARRPAEIQVSKVKELLGGDIAANSEARAAARELVAAYDDMARVRSEFGLDAAPFKPLREDAFAVYKELRRGEMLSVARSKAKDLAILPKRAAGAIEAIEQNTLMGSWGIGVVRPLPLVKGVARAMTQPGSKPLGTGAVATIIGEGMPGYARLPQLGQVAVEQNFSRGFQAVLREYGANIPEPPPGAVGRAKAGIVRAAQSPLGNAGGRLGELTETRGARGLGRTVPSSIMVAQDESLEPLPDTRGQEYAAVVGEQLRGIAEHTQERIDGIAGKLLGGGGTRAAPNLSKFTRGALPGATVNMRELLDGLAGDVGALLDQLVEGMGDVGQTHPALQQKMLMQGMRTIEYLKQHVPPATGRTPFNPKGYEPTFEQSYEFGLRYLGAVEPDTTLSDIAAGVAAPQQVEAFQTLWPSLYAQLVQSVMVHATSISGTGKRIPQERMRQLDMLLNLDGAGEPALSWAVADNMELARNQLQQQTQQPSRTTTTGASLSDNFATRRGARRELRRSM